MKAVIFRTHGGPEVLEYVTDSHEPAIGPSHVLVRVRACALNHLDLFVRTGIPTLKLPLPHILGSDIAGEIAKVGDEVDDLEEGERVVVNPGLTCGECEYCIRGEDPLCVEYKILGEHVNGGYAEFVAVPREKVARLPTDFSWEAAAAAPPVVLTPGRLLLTKAPRKPRGGVLIPRAGAGGSPSARPHAPL